MLETELDLLRVLFVILNAALGARETPFKLKVPPVWTSKYSEGSGPTKISCPDEVLEILSKIRNKQKLTIKEMLLFKILQQLL